jgi:hypothetical protein
MRIERVPYATMEPFSGLSLGMISSLKAAAAGEVTAGVCFSCFWSRPLVIGPYATVMAETLSLRHPGHAHALIHAFAPSKEIRIVAEPDSTEAANGEAWIERQSGLCGNTRLIEQPELR